MIKRTLVGVVVVALAAVLPGAARSAASAAEPTSVPIPRLPFVATASGAGGSGTAAGNDAVTTRCNAGAPIRDPQWFRLPRTDGDPVYARATATQGGRVTAGIPVGLAYVDATSGSVLGCAAGRPAAQLQPLTPASAQEVDVVVFLPEPYEAGTGDGVPDRLRLLVDRTSGNAPANDDWHVARPIAAVPLHQTVDTSLADDDNPRLGGCHWAPRHTAWWTYTATQARDLRLSVTSDLPSADGDVWPGASLAVARLTDTGPAQVVPSLQDECPTPVSHAGLRVEPGTTYLVGAFVAEDPPEPSLVLGGRITVDLEDATAPSAPIGAAVSKDDAARTARLSWAPPADDGGAPITGYRVARDGTDTGGTGAWSTVLPPTAVGITFRYLLPWATYHLSVHAINAVGTGPAAAPASCPRGPRP